MKKSEINPMPLFFDRYIDLVEEDDLMLALDKSFEALKTIDITAYKKVGEKTYEKGKWTIKDILQHVIDNERIQSYRTLRIARGDNTVLPGYDENLLAKNAFANNRRVEDIIEELVDVRKTTIHLYKSLDKTAFLNIGVCFNQNISPLALGFVIVGHQVHHLDVIKQKYLSL